MLERRTLSRREFLHRNAAVAGFLPFAHPDTSLPQEREVFKPPEIGDVVRDENGRTFCIQNELQGGKTAQLCRRLLPDFTVQQPAGFPKSRYVPSSLLRTIPELSLPEYTNNLVRIWDGSEKQYAPGTVLFLFIGGLHTSYRDNTFTPHEQALDKRFNADRRVFLNASYAERNGQPIRYTDKDTLIYPPQTKDIISKQIYRYKEQMPGIKVIGFGHSNGSWELLELAKEHPDFFVGIFLYHGALAGAGNPLIPQSVEDTFTQYFAGEAGTFHVQRGADPNVLKDVEKIIDDLRKKGVFTVTHSSTKDPFIDPKFSVMKNAQMQIGPVKITSLAPLETRTEWDVLENMPKSTPLEPDFSSTPSDTSARLATFRTDVGNHGAALASQQIIQEDMAIIESVLRTAARMSPEVKKEALRLRSTSPDAFLQFLIKVQSDMADSFSIQRFGVINRPSSFTVTVNTSDFDIGKSDAISWLRSTGLAEEHLSSLKITFQMEQVAQMKKALFQKEEDMLLVYNGFYLSYDPVNDSLSVTFRNRATGEPIFDRLLRSYGIMDRRWINNFSIKDS